MYPRRTEAGTGHVGGEAMRLTPKEIEYALSSQAYGWNQKAVADVLGHIAALQQDLEEVADAYGDALYRLDLAEKVVEAARLVSTNLHPNDSGECSKDHFAVDHEKYVCDCGFETMLKTLIAYDSGSTK